MGKISSSISARLSAQTTQMAMEVSFGNRIKKRIRGNSSSNKVKIVVRPFSLSAVFVEMLGIDMLGRKNV